MGMAKNNKESARHLSDRVSRLRRRFNTLLKMGNDRSVTQLAEMSALEWAIPILEKHIIEVHGELPPYRHRMFKHEYYGAITKLINRDGRDCYLCYKPMARSQMTIDHVIPLAKGGLDDMNNYKLAHNKCNVDKGNLSLEDYRRLHEVVK